ncbi:MAG: peptidoglycan DD-metalloendopeptidase family protein [Bacteroidia bacterium]|nr:peptidoglycan DD-metalloendopeptidase family protein [Bacteroidota bacterium]MBP9082186.1 peptidoglycan DD-metalloendopeptidase family protein [Bacteroidia bacterium]MBK7388868.1 peptidoglycan DD-metalloendopeptidase family protein [Bacteroidota bacterium]MBK7968310.1 peptidoglycan DD-metalloendopeptidase family protein [Bacteroidota bacterium]MBK8873349.1 peptidoglycan DD-metalloendopeptidase family protein [Bacteroidota bacterium]
MFSSLFLYFTIFADLSNRGKLNDCFWFNQYSGQPVEKPKKKIYRKLRNKYRLVIMNDETFEEKVSLTLSPLNVFVFTGTIIISLITFTIYIIAFTPLREYIPGYADVNMRRKLVALTFQTDSLTQKLNSRDRFLLNLRNIIDGNSAIDSTSAQQQEFIRYDTIRFQNASPDDSALRALVESQDRFTLSDGVSGPASSISSFYFFTPVKGTITSHFSPKTKHYGIDIVASPNEVIKNTLDGTVVLADWTSETGYIIAVQHTNNLFSIYKHNSALLKSVGDYVKAGEVLAIIGNTGELTSGPHLHFELWYNGSPVNPIDYMTF